MDFNEIVRNVFRYNSEDQDNFTQPALFWRKTLTDPERNRLVSNIVDHLKNAEDFLQVTINPAFAVM